MNQKYYWGFLDLSLRYLSLNFLSIFLICYALKGGETYSVISGSLFSAVRRKQICRI